MKKQIHFTESPGKTIAAIVENFMGTLVVTFTDGTFMAVKAERQWDDVIIDNEVIEVREVTDDMIAAGIATAEEVEAARDAHAAAWDRATEERDREQYERLKARFESR
jgi:hypothetical protein